ncbi:MAG: hydroxylamine reductase [Coriobacteriales bacterium]
MANEMFCFQCEQTAGGMGCTGPAGVCGKTAQVARLQDQLTGAVIGLARAVKLSGDGVSRQEAQLIIKCLFTTVTNVNFNPETVQQLVDEVHAARDGIASSDEAPDYDMNQIWNGDENVRSLKTLVLLGLRGMAAYAYHAQVLGYADDEVDVFFVTGMSALADELGTDELLALVQRTGEVNYTCMALLDKANTETFGTPEPADVTFEVERGPFVVITGHDLLDLRLLLEQAAERGVNVYTHGEMLSANAYPELRKYPNLKGNFGTAWQNQQTEFDNLPAPILYTTNCLMPPKGSYADRVFTTEMVSYPGATHIGADKDFTPVIDKALELGGFPEDTQFAGINGGTHTTTGFGHGTVLGIADKVVGAVKKGDIRHFFLVGGCDGADVGRNYYTEFVKQTPPDTVVLTLACGKFRFNDLDLGEIDGIPRLLDCGQCNDAYSAIQIALALAKAFDCDVNELPLSIVLSWYEQKAVCVLLTLLALGIRNILLGPALPAFVSNDVFNVLVKNYRLGAITTPEDDLKRLLA